MSEEDNDIAELAAPENVEAYVEERKEQEAESKPKDTDEAEVEKLTKDVRDKYGIEDEGKKASRHERRKRAREMLKAENEQLRSRLEGRAPAQEDRAPEQQHYDPSTADQGAIENSLALTHDKHGTEKFQAAFDAFKTYIPASGDRAAYNKVMQSADVGEALIEWYEQGGHEQAPQAPQDPYQEALEQGRQDHRFQTALAEREEQIRLETAVQFREQAFAARYPDYYEQVQTLHDFNIPPTMLALITRSECGPAMAYALARDAWEGQGRVFELDSIANDPIAQAKLVGAWEEEYRQFTSHSSAPQRATRAPAPLKPISGGSGGPRDLQSLAKSDDAEAYIRARRGNA